MRKIKIIASFIVCVLCLQSCEKKMCDGEWWNVEDGFEMCNIYKFADSCDYSNNLYIIAPDVIPFTLYPELRPIKLHGGYYLGGLGGVAGRDKIIYLTFTYDDFDNGNMPENWYDDWQQYVMEDNPYIEAYSCRVHLCPCDSTYYKNFPAYCEECNLESISIDSIARKLDTNKLNNWIDNHILEQFLIRKL